MQAGLLLAGAAALTLSAAAAHATVVTQAVTFGPGPTDYANATGAATAGGTTIAYFDTSLGTLNSVAFGSSYGFTSTIKVTNTSQGSSTGSAYTQSAAQFGASDRAVAAVLNTTVNTFNDPVDGTGVEFGLTSLSPIAYDVRGTRSIYTLATGATTSTASNGAGSTTGMVDATAADLATFSRAGGGAFTPLFTTLTGLVTSNNGGNVSAVQTTTGTGTLTITYDYTAAPAATSITEPASLGLLGAALFAIGVFRRRA